MGIWPWPGCLAMGKNLQWSLGKGLGEVHYEAKMLIALPHDIEISQDDVRFGVEKTIRS